MTWPWLDLVARLTQNGLKLQDDHHHWFQYHHSPQVQSYHVCRDGIAGIIVPSKITCKIAHKTCVIPLIFVFYVWWPFVTWSLPWIELSIKHLLNQYLALYFRSIRNKFWPKSDDFEVSTTRNLKAPILNLDLTLTWHVTSFGKFRGCFRIVSSRAFERRIARLTAAIHSRVMTRGRLTPPPSKSRVAKYPSNCRVNTLPIIFFWKFVFRVVLGVGFESSNDSSISGTNMEIWSAQISKFL